MNIASKILYLEFYRTTVVEIQITTEEQWDILKREVNIGDVDIFHINPYGKGNRTIVARTSSGILKNLEKSQIEYNVLVRDIYG